MVDPSDAAGPPRFLPSPLVNNREDTVTPASEDTSRPVAMQVDNPHGTLVPAPRLHGTATGRRR
jgi:hypothetical protein